MATTIQQATVTLNPSVPDVQTANRFAVTVNIAEFAIAFGHNRNVFHPNGEVAGTGVEYTQAFSLSPTAAKQLGMLLGYAVSEYEAAHGPIPEDKALVAKLKKMASGDDKPKAAPLKRRSKPAK